jgi:predicted nucleotidyltransferase component of viral defense system
MMNEALEKLLKKYTLTTQADYLNALKEVIQEIALLGLWRAKFFEHAAFYGGTALPILFGLNRFSEDLDFTLLKPQPDFKLEKYLPAIIDEVESFGLSISIQPKVKTFESKVKSAFLKGNTREHLIKIRAEEKMTRGHKEELFKIKLEVDTDPPFGFTSKTEFLLIPSSFSVRTLIPIDLFAGKIHAMLYRKWAKRVVKGRDWYDFIWYISREIPVSLSMLNRIMHQAGNLPGETLTHDKLLHLLEKKILGLNIELAKQDVVGFLKSKSEIDVWSQEFFLSLLPRLKVTA